MKLIKSPFQSFYLLNEEKGLYLQANFLDLMMKKNKTKPQVIFIILGEMRKEMDCQIFALKL